MIMATSWAQSRCRDVVEELSQAGLAWDAFCHEAVPPLRAAVGFDCWCLTLCDPGNALPAHGVADNPPVGGALGRFWHIEYQLPDVNKHAWLGQNHRLVGILSAATRSDLARSTRWQQLLGPGGLGDELRAAVVADRVCWGELTFYRQRRTEPFSDDDAAFVSGLIPALAGAARGAWRAPSPPGTEPVTRPGVIVVSPADQIAAATPIARIWLERIGPDYRSQVQALTARLRADAGTPGSPTATLCTRTRDGQWIELHAAPLSPPARGDVAISVQAARPETTTAILMRAHTLSRREREVTSLLLRGLSAAEIAARLHISGHTARDHLKAIYAKTGARGRGRLAAQLAPRNDRDPESLDRSANGEELAGRPGQARRTERHQTSGEAGP
jgi:DNA-binding CsgD family transcriptional regulator